MSLKNIYKLISIHEHFNKKKEQQKISELKHFQEEKTSSGWDTHEERW